jgi:hypothetical protein
MDHKLFFANFFLFVFGIFNYLQGTIKIKKKPIFCYVGAYVHLCVCVSIISGGHSLLGHQVIMVVIIDNSISTG